MLAAARMFNEKSDILHINNFEVRKISPFHPWVHHVKNKLIVLIIDWFVRQELSTELMVEGVKHSKKIEGARNQFPHLEVDAHKFPEESAN